MEGLAPHTLIGNVAIDSGLNDKYGEDVRARLNFTFAKQAFFSGDRQTNDTHLFEVDSSSGILKTATEIDRDVLCARQIQCLVILNVAVGPGDYFELINVVVDILDVNDHAPVFPRNEITRKVSEATEPGTSFTIPTATDPDSQQYGVQKYELVSSSNNFELQDGTGQDGASELRLYIKEKLDREKADFYQFKVVAHDGGSPSKSGSVLVNIEVEDFNDNDPAFDNATYEIFVSENSAVGTTIGNVRALDQDTGDNGRISYGFSRKTQSDYGDMFGIVESTGAIYLKHPLDFERGSTYLLYVTASDGGSESQAGLATVIVRVEDINDNLPEININTLTADGVAKIPETAGVGVFVAHVYASDMDGGLNGQLQCSVDSQKFELEQQSLGKYELLTSGKLDFERQSIYHVVVSCMDLGLQPKTSTSSVEVQVTDGNDNSPLFSKQVYMTSIRENNFVEQSVLQVTATDSDQGGNGQVRYKLHSDAMGLFKIHKVTGAITTNAIFDREVTEELSFHVIAYDGGVPSLQSTATVIVTILDANDEGPVFSPAFFTFGFYENEPPNTEVGQVTAADADTTDFNAFEYKFTNPSGEAAQAFKIDPHTGKIYSRVQLDREEKAAYYMTVIATSDQFPPMTSTASVTIYIADQNDHNPEITWPTSYNNTVQMPAELPAGAAVTRIEAHDVDIGGNGKLTYSILPSQGHQEYFSIDSVLGVVTLAKELGDLRTYRLNIEVVDGGFPQLANRAQLNVIVNSSMPYTPSDDDVGGPTNRVVHKNNNTTIIISLASSSLVLIFLLIIAVVLFRRQQKGGKPMTYDAGQQPVIRTESQKMLQLSDGRVQNLPHGREKQPIAKSSTCSKEKDLNCVINMTGCNVPPQKSATHPMQVSRCAFPSLRSMQNWN